MRSADKIEKKRERGSTGSNRRKDRKLQEEGQAAAGGRTRGSRRKDKMQQQDEP
jgi:hypothetical protein